MSAVSSFGDGFLLNAGPAISVCRYERYVALVLGLDFGKQYRRQTFYDGFSNAG